MEPSDLPHCCLNDEAVRFTAKLGGGAAKRLYIRFGDYIFPGADAITKF
jgi:hypothetical protein